ncbi:MULTISPECIES: membrane protein insertase YidC [unclassified Oceanobacter]|uniref:membrane protein insertase YidC n=1 Tax=unclassified Oceanobacter TaxID=2620260 RepID=UPI0026E2857F|nr:MULTISPECIES: membrane protein insertase YidC [unclassified Oceanobacter]MDO6680843.1 membrane protein insertase YidC [Oceanobacter sp. 5_MG-2023]MDP2607757.1 membrane protein insertase YidC [Oceanobacter sp. 1_MG-2023]MDP2611059.1 membrane protein insertase YidC [Oceanobacter sp. 2_MG-2023]
MDIRRTVIYLGLAISSYFIFITWNDDYGQKTRIDAPIQAETPAIPDVPSVADVTADAEHPQLEAPQISSTGSAPTPSGELIRIKTDVLQVTINPRGGEVTEVLLPEFPASIETKDIPFVLLENNQRRTYVAQSGLIGRDGIDTNGGALFSAAKNDYTLTEGDDELVVVLSTETDKGMVEKVFTFHRGNYLIDMQYRIHNNSSEPWEGVFYAQLKRDASPDPSAGSGMGMQAYLGAALTTKENRYEKITFDDLEDEVYKNPQEGGWAAMLQHYFLSAWVPSQDATHTYNGRFVKGNYIFGFYDQAMVVAPGTVGETGASLYVGPKDQDSLEQIAPHLELTVDYGWLWWIAQPLFFLLTFFHSIVGNWGVAIILLTLCVKILFFYPSAVSYRSMANMRKVGPKMQQIKEQYGDNREKLGQEMMALYKKEKINPLGGCLPMLIQMPVFISLYWVLMESVELRQAPFALWITDMSVMDPYFILPLLMGASMFVQMRLNPTPPDPMQARVMQFMPVMMTVFFLWFPAGLVLYWVVNNLLSIAQQYVITKQIENS